MVTARSHDTVTARSHDTVSAGMHDDGTAGMHDTVSAGMHDDGTASYLFVHPRHPLKVFMRKLKESGCLMLPSHETFIEINISATSNYCFLSKK